MDLARLPSLSTPHPGGFREIPPLGVFPRLAGFRVVDVREPVEFVGPLGHLAGAELVPLAALGGRASAWAPSDPLLLVCRTGARSATACGVLVRLGFQQVYNLAGGMLVWNENRLPVCR